SISRSPSSSRAGRIGPGVTGCFSTEPSSAAASAARRSASSSLPRACSIQAEAASPLGVHDRRPVIVVGGLQRLREGGEGGDLFLCLLHAAAPGSADRACKAGDRLDVRQ